MTAASSRAPAPVPAPSASENPGSNIRPASQQQGPGQLRRHPVYNAAWYLLNAALVVAVVWALYALSWELSTRRYLRGFSDAIVPATASAEEKIEAILNWMALGPARLKQSPDGSFRPDGSVPDRDPTDTLNYDALLRVCGTATNAFINLVDSGGLEARRLLLVDSHQMTKHVVAEVLVSGRWIIADPAYRVLWRGPDGRPLTREELANPVTFTAVTQGVRNYDPSYTFDHTAHIRLARLRFVGLPMRSALDRITPGWEDSMTATLLVERSSFAAAIVALLIVVGFIVLRVALRWFGEKRLGLRTPRIHRQFLRACHTFLDTAS